jgi:hypothetical protein
VTRARVSSGSPWEGPYGYSRAVVDGDACWVAGTTDPSGEHLDDPAGVEWLLVDRDLVAPEHKALLEGLLATEFTVRSERDGIVLAERTSPPLFPRESQPPPFLCEPRPSSN